MKLAIIIVNVIILAFHLYVLYDDLTKKIEKEKHADVYESYFRMYKEQKILKFTINVFVSIWTIFIFICLLS